MTKTNPSARTRTRTQLLLLVAVAALLFSACSSASEPLDAEVTRQFDTGGNRLADLTPADGAEVVSREALLRSIAAAESVGTALRVVVAAPDGDFVPAKSVVDRYGGTVISYQANRTTFEGASRDMSADQLDRAIDAARVELDIGDSAAAFVSVLQAEGLDKSGNPLSNLFGGRLVVVLLLLAVLFMLWGLWSYVSARKRRAKRQTEFAERKRVLMDWASQLGPEVEALRPRVVAVGDDSAQQTWHETQTFVGQIDSTLGSARNAGDLDAAEMRIGRVAMKLRDLRRTIDSKA